MENDFVTYPLPIGYKQMLDSLLMMWIENIVTDGEYYKILDRLDEWYGSEVNNYDE